MLAPILALAMLAPENLTSGAHLYKACKATVDSMERPDPHPTWMETALTSDCLSYIEGVIDGHGMRPDPLFCLGGATNGTIIRVYLKYMDGNPKLLDSPRLVGVLLSLTDSYPCPAK